MIRIACTALALALTISPVAAFAGDLTGTVLDSSAMPVAGAQVSIAGLERAVITDADGRYVFEGLSEGEYRIAVRLADDARQHASASVPEAGEAKRDIFLLSPAALDHARNGVNPAEALLAEAQAARAWEEASEMAAQMGEGEGTVLPGLTG
ncbi:carboxypeptidase-like regulatory domain-containing protein [Aurantiacibacter poecillastricola]|uniref:carboxypeptidase-like regulatory domain-containing protein n=1 Tax=Aurantiacibacter poecillastricola TaxID=3064385 RepID=UPI00273DB573|nr:carboxypeptidase-like regulatory domain-containing protein [Aurantiacibacter sp. 219JJ12-13]MDP5261568.1 carboxypeptidase-like regulatory domain-containing protein [Aurantiacibacter sp. 219JJ12-13]